MGVPSKGVISISEAIVIRFERRGKTSPKDVWVNGHYRSHPTPIPFDLPVLEQLTLSFGHDIPDTNKE